MKEIILDESGWPTVIAWALKNGRGGQENHAVRDTCGKKRQERFRMEEGG